MNSRNDGSYSKMNLPKGNHYGLIAQDVEKYCPTLWKKQHLKPKMPIRTRQRRPKLKRRQWSRSKMKNRFQGCQLHRAYTTSGKSIAEQDAKIDALTNELRTIKQSQTTATATETTSAVTVNSVVAAIKVQPNPAKSAVTISGLNKTGMINIIDMQGRQLLRQVVNSNNVVMNISSLSAGTYIIQYLDNGKPKP